MALENKSYKPAKAKGGEEAADFGDQGMQKRVKYDTHADEKGEEQREW